MAALAGRSMIALTRPVPPALDRCELTYRGRVPIDAELAAAQHASLERALESAGCRLVRAPAAPELPDSVFVEDMAVVTDEVAVLARPGAASRRPEVDGVAAVLREHRRTARIVAPGTLEGGDVLQLGRDVFVGRSSRTNAEGAGQLRSILEPLGFAVRDVPVTGCLHLKSAVTAVAEDTVLLNPRWVDREAFGSYRVLEVPADEPGAANILRVGDRVTLPAAHAATAQLLKREGIQVAPVDVSELAKAEAGVTCCCILVRPRP